MLRHFRPLRRTVTSPHPTTTSTGFLRSYSSDFQRRVGPIPLGNRAEQQAFDEAVQKHEISPDDPQADLPANPAVITEPLEAFENDVNPTTGERGGPRGPEPTRYGDWERNGRVYDF
ncbi:hypothetical protein H4R33_001702 [Dimargaris cristalligena]|uniref:Succinate dehydrogenase assembly factor 4, mitochondrial n=1 Tax=Dimargaris cristalligena TaxID=215637 RepID=A0A4P9ZRF1_9FUNG|nr:hypothetical protein H4R33_001702 [Dimargaris cristalligena]RKP36106.1 hypothetical protein BJ085DRAFT_28720 [Dimargaris cristalligena]|eukprot:RKP36106.1 hypothetical protein BJ085DRAFT_28720 [Dimargaris cristalligena]